MAACRAASSRRALSVRERRQVEANLPLVHLTLQRLRKRMKLSAPGRERRELFQEGCLALVEAVRAYDSSRHGAFPCFAMARIHFAVSSFVRENAHLIRVPFITQRRRKRRVQEGSTDRHNPDGPPTVESFDEESHVPPSRRAGPAKARLSSAWPDELTVGEMIRERYETALDRAVMEMKRTDWATKEDERLLDRCADERWMVPEPEDWTPIREMARESKCSPTRVARWERRFRRQVARIMESDVAYAALRDLARGSRFGMSRRLTREECEAVAKRAVEPVA